MFDMMIKPEQTSVFTRSVRNILMAPSRMDTITSFSLHIKWSKNDVLISYKLFRLLDIIP